jgi:hypothetical protein
MGLYLQHIIFFVTPASLTNIRLGLEVLPGTKTLAYWTHSQIRRKKMFSIWPALIPNSQHFILFITLALLANIRLGRKDFLGTNTLAYRAHPKLQRK